MAATKFEKALALFLLCSSLTLTLGRDSTLRVQKENSQGHGTEKGNSKTELETTDVLRGKNSLSDQSNFQIESEDKQVGPDSSMRKFKEPSSVSINRQGSILGDDTQDKYETPDVDLPQTDVQNRIPKIRKFEKTSRMIEVENRRKQTLNVVAQSLGLLKWKVWNYQHKFLMHVIRNRNTLNHRQNTLRTNMIRILRYIRRLHSILHPPAKIPSNFENRMDDVERRTNAVLSNYQKFLRPRKMFLKNEPKKHFIYKSLRSLASPPPQRRSFVFPRFRKPPDHKDATVNRCPIFYHNLYAKILHKFLLRYRNAIHRLMSVLATRENHSTEKRDFFPEVVLRILQENFRSRISYELKNRLNLHIKKNTHRLQIWRKILTENRFFQRRLYTEFRRFKNPQRHVFCWRMWVVDKLLPLLNTTPQSILNVFTDTGHPSNRQVTTNTSFIDMLHKVFFHESTPQLGFKKSLAKMYEYVYDKISGIFSVFKDARNPSLRVSSVWRLFKKNTSDFKTGSSFDKHKDNLRNYGFRYKSLEIFQRLYGYIHSVFRCFCRLKDKIVGYFTYVKDKFLKCLPSKTFFTETLSVSRMVRVCLEKYKKFLQDAMNELEKFKGKGKEQQEGKQNKSINSTPAPVKEVVQVLQKSQNNSDGLRPASKQESVDGLKVSKEEERIDTKQSDTLTDRSDTMTQRSDTKTGSVKYLKEIRLRDLLTNVVFKNVLRNRLKNKTSYALGKSKEGKDKADESNEITENTLSQFSEDRMRSWSRKRRNRRRRDIAGVQNIEDKRQNKHGELVEKSTQISIVDKEVTDLKKSYLSQQAFALMKRMRVLRRLAVWLLLLPQRAMAFIRRVEAANLKLRMAMFEVFFGDKLKKLDSKSNEETQDEKHDEDDTFEEWKAQYYDEPTHKILVNLKKQFMKKPNSEDETVDDRHEDEKSNTATPKSLFSLEIVVRKNTTTGSTLKDLLTKDVNKPTALSISKQNKPRLISRRKRSALKNMEASHSKPDSVNNLQAKLKELTDILDSNFKTSTESSERNIDDDSGLGQQISNDNIGDDDKDKSQQSDDEEVKLTELTRQRVPYGSHIKKDGSGDYIINLGNNKLRKLHASKLDTADQMRSKLMGVLNSVRENEKTALENILSQTSGLRKNHLKGQSVFQHRKADSETYGNHSVFDDTEAIEAIKEQIQHEYEDDGENTEIEESALSSTVLFPPKPDGNHPSYDDYKLLKNIEKLAYNFLKENGKTKKGKNKLNTASVESLGNPDAKILRSKRAVDVDEAVIGDTKPNDFVEEWSKLRGQAQKLAKSVNKAKNKYAEASGEIENIMKQGDDLKNKIVLNVGDNKPNQAVVQENWGKIKQEFEDFQKDVERKENVAAEDKAQFLGREEIALLKLEDAANEHSDVQDPEINEIFSSVHLGTERLAPALGAMEYNRNMLDQTGDPDDLTNLEDPAGGIYREQELGDESPIPNFDYSSGAKFLSEDINDMRDDMELMTEYEYDIDSHADPQLENLDSMLQSMRSKVRVIREADPHRDFSTREPNKEDHNSNQKNQIHDLQVDTKSIIGTVDESPKQKDDKGTIHESSIPTKHNRTVSVLSEPTQYKGNDSESSNLTAHKGNDTESSKLTEDEGTVLESATPTERKVNVGESIKPTEHKGNDNESLKATAHEGTVLESAKSTEHKGTVPESAIAIENKGNIPELAKPTGHEETVPKSAIPTEHKGNVESSKLTEHKGNDTESSNPTAHKGNVPETAIATEHKGHVPELAKPTDHKGIDLESSKPTDHKRTVPKSLLPPANKESVQNTTLPEEDKGSVPESSLPTLPKESVSKKPQPTLRKAIVKKKKQATLRKARVQKIQQPIYLKYNGTVTSLPEESDAGVRNISVPEASAPEIAPQTTGSTNDGKKKQNSSSDITSPGSHQPRHNITKRQAEVDARIKQLSLDDATEEEVKEDANFDQLFPKEHYDANEYRYDQYYDFNDDDTDLDKDETLNVPPSVGDVAADISGKTLLYDIGGMEYDKDTTINELSNMERPEKMDVLDKDGDSSLKNLEEFNPQPQTIDKAMKDVHRASDLADLPNPLGLNEKDDVRAIGQRHGIETDVEREVLDRGLPLGSNSDIDNEISDIGKEKLDDGIEDEDFNADFPEIDDISPFTNAIKDQMGDYTDLEVPKEELPELLHTQLGRVEKARINGIRTEAWKDSYDIVEKTKKVRLKEEHLYQKDMMEFEKINRGLNRTLQELDNMTNQLEEAMNHQVLETLKPHVDNDKEILGFELSTISPNVTLQLKLLEAKWNIYSDEKRKNALKEIMLDNKKIKKPIKVLRNEKTVKVMMDGNKPGVKVGLKSITTRYNKYRRKSHPPLEAAGGAQPDDFGKVENKPDKFLVRQFKNGNVQGRVKLRHWGDKVGGRIKPVNFGTEVVGTWEKEPEANSKPASKTEDGPVGDSPKYKGGARIPKMKSITKKTTSYIVDESDKKEELKGGKAYNTNRLGGNAEKGEDTRDSRQQGHVIQKREVNWPVKTGEEDVDYKMLAKSNVDDDDDNGERQELAEESLLEVAESPDKSQIFTPKEKVDDIAVDVIPTDTLVDVKEAARHFKEEEEMADFVLPPTLTEADEKFVMENGIDKNDPDNYKKAEDQTDNDIEIENIGDPFLAEEGVVSEIRDMQEADDIDEEISSAVESLEKESVGDLQNVQKDIPEVEDVSTGQRLANIAFDNDRTMDRTFQQFKDLEEDRVKALEDHVQRERDETLDDVRLEQIDIKKEAGNVLEDSEYMAEAVEDVERYSDKMDKDNLIVLSQD